MWTFPLRFNCYWSRFNLNVKTFPAILCLLTIYGNAKRKNCLSFGAFSCPIVFQSSVIRPGLCFCVFLIQGKPNYLRKLIVGLTGILTCDLRHGKIKAEREYRNDYSQRFKVKQDQFSHVKKEFQKPHFTVVGRIRHFSHMVWGPTFLSLPTRTVSNWKAVSRPKSGLCPQDTTSWHHVRR